MDETSKQILDDAHWEYLIAYLAMNPVKAALVPYCADWDASSYPELLGLLPRAPWLSTHAVDLFGSREKLRDFVESVERGWRSEPARFERARTFSRGRVKPK